MQPAQQQKRPSSQWRKDRPSSTVASNPKHGQERNSKPSYLSQTKEAFFQLYTEVTGQSGTSVDEDLEQLWKFLSTRIIDSFWNGVNAGASGRVKPKPRTPQAPSPAATPGGEWE